MKKLFVLCLSFIIACCPLITFASSVSDTDSDNSLIRIFSSKDILSSQTDDRQVLLYDQYGVEQPRITLSVDKAISFTMKVIDFSQEIQSGFLPTLTFSYGNNLSKVAQDARTQMGFDDIDDVFRDRIYKVNDNGLYALQNPYESLIISSIYNFKDVTMLPSGHITGKVEAYLCYQVSGTFEVSNNELIAVNPGNQYVTYHFTIDNTGSTFTTQQIDEHRRMYSFCLLNSSYKETFNQFDMEVLVDDQPTIQTSFDENNNLIDLQFASGTPVYTANLLQNVGFNVTMRCTTITANLVFEEMDEPVMPVAVENDNLVGAVVSTTAISSVLGVAGTFADNVSDKRLKTKTIKTKKVEMNEAVEDGEIEVNGISTDLVNEKNAKVLFEISNSQANLKWHYISKVLVGSEVVDSKCVKNELILTLSGNEIDEDKDVSILIVGWAIGLDGKLHKGFAGFEVTIKQPGLTAEYDSNGNLEVIWTKSGKVKGIAYEVSLSNEEYTIQEDRIICNADENISCSLPNKN